MSQSDTRSLAELVPTSPAVASPAARSSPARANSVFPPRSPARSTRPDSARPPQLPARPAPSVPCRSRTAARRSSSPSPRRPSSSIPSIAGSNGYGDIIPIHDNLNEGLTRFKPGSAEIEAALAESWTASDDGLSYTSPSAPGVTFHDGTPSMPRRSRPTSSASSTRATRSTTRAWSTPASSSPDVDRGRGDRRPRSHLHPRAADQTGPGQPRRLRRPGSPARPRSRPTATTSASRRSAPARSSSISWTKDVELVLRRQRGRTGAVGPRSTASSGARSPRTRSALGAHHRRHRRRQPDRLQGRRNGRGRREPAGRHRSVLERPVPGRSTRAWRRSTTCRSARRSSTRSTSRTSPTSSSTATTPSAPDRSRRACSATTSRWPRSTPTIRSRRRR